jgi:hypothetical protein
MRTRKNTPFPSPPVIPDCGEDDAPSQTLDQVIEGLRQFCPSMASHMEAVLKRVDHLESLFRRQFDDARLLTREQTAALLSCSVSQVDRWIVEGKLHPVYLDRRPRVALADVVSFWQARRRSSVFATR